MNGTALSLALISFGAFVTSAAIRVASGPDNGYVMLSAIGMTCALAAGFFQSQRQSSK